MKVFSIFGSALLLAAVLCAGFLGCTRTGSSPGESTTAASQTGGDHSGWWCVEHGIPEEECSMCSSKAAADFKSKGDWCEDHNRAKSQCFKCEPALAEKYAKLYVAKYGKEPPKHVE